jgi:REP element-mobilizing transposase RayT
MPRARRRWVSQLSGSFHLISRIAGGELLLKTEEKEQFLNLLEKFAAGFFVQIHSFAIMGNHFHILATGMEQEAQEATKKELFQRYRLIYGKNAEPSSLILMKALNDYENVWAPYLVLSRNSSKVYTSYCTSCESSLKVLYKR